MSKDTPRAKPIRRSSQEVTPEDRMAIERAMFGRPLHDITPSTPTPEEPK